MSLDVGEQRTVKSLAAFIAKNISYDGASDGDGVKCPHCGKMAREEVVRHWIDHRSILEGQIISFLKLTPRVATIIGEVMEYFPVDGDKKRDGEAIAKAIWKEVYGS